ncbi:MAG: hypothetical protein ABEJ67_07115 [Halanaeroarchaeum sp.]
MDLWDDDRGQSVQIGAVLLFAVLIISLATYQSTVVPNDNEAAEFDHSLEVREDMLEVRNAILDSFQSGEAAPVAVRMGMTYPGHTFAVDPPPVAGSIRTVPAGSISVTASGSPVAACGPSNATRYLTYSADYAYLRPTQTLVYENTVLYADYGENRTVLLSDQSLVTGDRIDLVALQGNYSENGIGATAFEPIAGAYRRTSVTDPVVRVPTRLSESRWESLLADEVEPDRVTVDAARNLLVLDLQGTYSVRCGLVGADTPPEGGVRVDTGDDDGTGINPATPGSVVVTDFRYDSGQKQVEADFENTGDSPRNITRARIAFYYASSDNRAPESVSIVGQQDVLDVGDPMTSISPEIGIGANETTTVSFESASDERIERGDYFVFQVGFENGDRGTYFVFVPGSGNDKN